MSQSKPVDYYTLHLALATLAHDTGVERVRLFDYEDSHVTFARGVFSWHRADASKNLEHQALRLMLDAILASLSSVAHFEIQHYNPCRDVAHEQHA